MVGGTSLACYVAFVACLRHFAHGARVKGSRLLLARDGNPQEPEEDYSEFFDCQDSVCALPSKEVLNDIHAARMKLRDQFWETMVKRVANRHVEPVEVPSKYCDDPFQCAEDWKIIQTCLEEDDQCEYPEMSPPDKITGESYPHLECVKQHCLQNQSQEFQNRISSMVIIGGSCYFNDGNEKITELCDVHEAAAEAAMTLASSQDFVAALESAPTEDAGDDEDACETMLEGKVGSADELQARLQTLQQLEDKKKHVAEQVNKDKKQIDEEKRKLDEEIYDVRLQAMSQNKTLVGRASYFVCKKMKAGLPRWMKILWKLAPSPVLIWMAMSVMRCGSMPLSCAQSVAGFGLMSTQMILNLLASMGFPVGQGTPAGLAITMVAHRALVIIEADLEARAVTAGAKSVLAWGPMLKIVKATASLQSASRHTSSLKARQH